MPRFVISRIANALNEDGKALKGSRVLLLGLSYKANIDDPRESPSFELWEQLTEAGVIVQYCDPYFPEAPRMRKYKVALSSVPCTPEAFAGFDALVVATAHDEFKKPELYRNVKLVVDSRNMIAPLLKDLQGSPMRLVKA
jgi:UDP-N-acetyl-D-glucosamine dehydrogenase